ncbi:MAG: hypothetical protein RL748_4264 [Pseudomonadota bacterium]|jgi:KDO2-lipid IV(A) lauroyltransferase
MRLLLALMWLMHFLPLPLLGRFGKLVGTLLFHTLRSRRHITLTNLRLCMPHLSEAERQLLAKQHFQAYSRSVWERSILWWAPEARLKRLIQVEAPGVPLAQIQAGPTIILCPHFVCLDVAGVAVMLQSSLCSIYVRQSNRVFDRALRRGRSRFRPVELFSRNDGIKPIIRAMREGLPYFMLPDLDFGIKNAEFVPFFGIPAATLSAPARLAASTQAKLIPVVASFLPDYQGWKIQFYPAWDNYPSDDIVADTRRMNEFIEQRTLEHPADYFWSHKRFKTRPPGEPNLYQKPAAQADPVNAATEPQA